MTVRRRHANALGVVARTAAVGALVAVAAAQPASAPVNPPTDAPEPPAAERASEAPVAEPAQPPRYSLLTAKQLTGDWCGARAELQDGGITFEPLFGVEYQQNFRGGANTHNAHDVAGMVFWNLEFDFGKMNLVPGGSFFARGLQSWNSGVRADVGSLMHPGIVVSTNGDREIEIQKWWWRQRLWDDRLEFRLGKLYTGDVMECVEYASNPIAKFLNQANFKNATTPHVLALGAYAKVWPADWLYLSGLVADSDADGDLNRRGTAGFDSTFHGPAHFCSYWEVGFLPAELPGAAGMWPGHYRFGGWYDPRPKAVFISDPGGNRATRWENGEAGFYVNLDQMVWKESTDPADKQGLGLFARYGYARQDVNLISHYWAAGAEVLGLVPARDEDTLGFSVAQCILSGQHRSNVDPLDDRETIYELYYALKLTPWCTVSPDIQIITNPGGRRDARDALVAGVRVTISF